MDKRRKLENITFIGGGHAAFLLSQKLSQLATRGVIQATQQPRTVSGASQSKRKRTRSPSPLSDDEQDLLPPNFSPSESNAATGHIPASPFLDDSSDKDVVQEWNNKRLGAIFPDADEERDANLQQGQGQRRPMIEMKQIDAARLCLANFRPSKIEIKAAIVSFKTNKIIIKRSF